MSSIIGPNIPLSTAIRLPQSLLPFLWPSFTPIQDNRKIYSFVYFNLYGNFYYSIQLLRIMQTTDFSNYICCYFQDYFALLLCCVYSLLLIELLCIYFIWANEQLNSVFYFSVLTLQCGEVTYKSDKQRCFDSSLHTSWCRCRSQFVLPCNW